MVVLELAGSQPLFLVIACLIIFTGELPFTAVSPRDAVITGRQMVADSGFRESVQCGRGYTCICCQGRSLRSNLLRHFFSST